MKPPVSKVSTHDAELDPRNADLRIYVNGEIVQRDEAKVSVYDSGFMLGDGVCLRRDSVLAALNLLEKVAEECV